MNVLIVESENDQYFVEALVRHQNLKIDKFISITKFEHASLDEEKLATKIGGILGKTEKPKKLGIILDMDNSTTKQRLELVNRAFKKAFQENDLGNFESEIQQPNTFIELVLDEYITVQVACYFTNVDKNGELEDVLKNIAKQDSTFADCLEAWRKCFEEKGKKLVKKGEQGGNITDKEFVKLWVDFYKRFDTLKKGTRDKDTTNWKNICLGDGDEKKGKKQQIPPRVADIFDLDSSILSEMKAFLGLFT